MRNANLIVKAGMLVTCLPFIGCNSANKSEKSQEERPNILFILSDDHTSQAWGIYGGILADYVKNENIRRLAAEGEQDALRPLPGDHLLDEFGRNG